LTRVFVAVSLPDAVLDAVEGRVARIAVPGRLTTRDQWHLTLQFLGNRADVDAVAAALDGLDEVGGEVRIGGAGAFPRATRGTVLWLGVVEGGAVLERLAEAVALRTASLGHERETRPYRPHVTLARGRAPSDLRDAIAALGDAPVGPAWRVEAVTVYESRTRREGAQYTPRATIPLPRRRS
jgi:2'-5' RNA ligase